MDFKKSELIIIFFPSVIMVLITSISFSNILDSLIAKNFFVLSLMFIFPLAFFIQGIAGAQSEVNVHIGLTISLAAFIIIATTVLNSTAYAYVPVYLLMGLIGYGLSTLLFKKT